MRILVSSSSAAPWYEIQDCVFHYEKQRYSLGAIMFHLERSGHQIHWAGRKSTVHPVRLAKVIDDFKPDIVYTYGSSTALTPLFCRRFLCHWRNFKVIHGWDDLYGDIWGNMFGWPGRIFMNIVERQIITRSDAVVTLSHFLQDRGRRWGVECKYIPNGADIIPPSQVKGAIQLQGDLKLVYTGDQARWKRTADICEAMRHVPNNIKLYLTGQHYAYLDKYASKNCVFLGYVSKTEQYNVMNQADVFVVTANQDCNAKLQEYLRWGKPILGYDDRPNLFFKNGRNALLTKDYPAAILRLYHDPAFRARLSKNARDDIRVYDWTEIAGQFEEFFKSISHNTRTQP